MRVGTQSRFARVWLVIITFGLVFTNISRSAPIDLKTVDVAYLFDEGKGNVAKDISGNDRNGEISGAKYVKGVFGTCLEYDGKDDSLVVSDYAGVGGTDPRTTVFWFKAGDTRDHSWVKWGEVLTGRKYYIRAHLRAGGCNLRVEVSGGQNYGEDNVCDEKWHHMAVVFPKGADSVKNHDLYVDGKLQTKEGNDQKMDTNPKIQEVSVGETLGQHKFMFGLFDEFAVFNVGLSKNQINAIMKNGLRSALGVDPREKLTTSWAVIKTY